MEEMPISKTICRQIYGTNAHTQDQTKPCSQAGLG
jgi:hypothetical protein